MKFSIKVLFLSFLLSNLAYAQTAAILPPAKTIFIDKNGKPLTSGTADFYIPGTTTRKTTWQDAAETIPNANPVVLDGSGGALILGSGSYRQIIKDRLGNVIWDQVTASGGSGGGGGPTATGDGDLVGTVKPWAGMTAPNQYMFTYGEEVSRATFSVLFTAITSTQSIFCNSGSPILNGLSDTSNFWVGMTLEVSCVPTGNSTLVSKTATTITMAGNANVTTNANAVFFPWGRGNGTTTFNLPDFRGFVLAGNNIMGGTSGSNLTATFFGVQDPNSSGAAGGSQSTSVTLLTANLPPYTPAGSVSGSFSGTAPVQASPNQTGTGSGFTDSINGGSTAVSGSISGTLTGTAQGGTSTPIVKSIVQPTKTANYIIKVTPDANSATASGVTSLGGMTGSIGCGTGLLCTGNIVSVSGNVGPPSPIVLGGVFSKTCNTSNWFNSLDTTGAFNCLQPNFTDLLGSIAIGQIPNSLITYSKIQNGAGLSLVGVTGNAAAVNADIVGTANQIVRVNGAGTVLAFGSIDLSQAAAVGSSLLALANGGCNATLTASNGGILWSNATQCQILAGTATARLPLLSGANAAPVWGAFTLPATAVSGGVLCFTSTTVSASSVLQTANAIMLGGGAGACPSPLGALGTTTTILHGNAAGAPTFGSVVFADLATGAVATSAQYLAGTSSVLVQAGTLYQAETTTTFGTTTTFDFSTFINTNVTLTANITTQTLTNVAAGKAGTIAFTQSGAGSFTTVWNSIFKFAGGTTPSLTTGSTTAVDILSYSCRSATFCVASLIKDVR